MYSKSQIKTPCEEEVFFKFKCRREMVSSKSLTRTIMLFFPPLLKIIEVILSAILRHFPIFKQRLIYRIHVLKTYCG